MKGNEENQRPTEIWVTQVDARAGYRQGPHYPNLIYLATVLRWAVVGNVSSESYDSRMARYSSAPLPKEATIEERRQRDKDLLYKAYIRPNNFAIDSMAALLADKIELGNVPVLNAQTMLLLGKADIGALVAKLRSLDGGNVSGLIDEDGENYYLDGHALYKAVMEAAAPNTDFFEKGGVWRRLRFDAPSEWRTVKPESSLSASMSEAPTAPVKQSKKPRPRTETTVQTSTRLCQEAAERIWRGQVSKITIAEMMRHPDIAPWVKKYPGKNTVRNWLSEVAPAEVKGRRGRPKNTRLGK